MKMEIMRKRYIIIFVIMILLVSYINISSSVRFYPTHSIVKQVNCFSCHIDELEELKVGRHINAMNVTQNRALFDYIALYGNISEQIKSLEGPCFSCHITYNNYNLFGLTDPYVFNGFSNENINVQYAQESLDAQYGHIINWPSGNKAIEYFDVTDISLIVELEASSIEPADAIIDSTMKVVFRNYSGQQTGNTVYEDITSLYQGGKQTLVINNAKNDYFNVVLILDGVWNSSVLTLRVDGTDKGTESFTIYANSRPAIFDVPKDLSSSFFKTNGTYKAVRLDYVWSEWRNYTVADITSSEKIETSSVNGWIAANTCSAPDAMCHINQKTTYLGLSDGMNPDKSFYLHKMEFVTTKQCKLCHLNNR